MRGSPLGQAAIVLVVLISLGWFGSRFLKLPPPSPTPSYKTKEKSPESLLEAEVQMTFSSIPDRFALRSAEQADVPVAAKENPVFLNIAGNAGNTDTYWLDIVWAESPVSDSRHFVEVRVESQTGDEFVFSFRTGSESLKETFEIQWPEKTDDN